jgi:hypothetical protein
VGSSNGNKVTKTIFIGSREFIMLVDSGEIISQSPEPQSVSGPGLNTYSLSANLLQNVLTVTGNCAELGRGLQLCRAGRKLLVDSEWGNHGEYQTQ